MKGLPTYLVHCVLFFVCLEFLVHSKKVHSYGDVTIAGERLQILTYARHVLQLSSEGSLACQTYCDTGHPFIKIEILNNRYCFYPSSITLDIHRPYLQGLQVSIIWHYQKYPYIFYTIRKNGHHIHL